MVFWAEEVCEALLGVPILFEKKDIMSLTAVSSK